MPPILTSANLTMRPANPADVERRFEIGAEPAGNLRLYGVQPASAAPFTRESAERWVQSLIEHPYAWVIEGAGLLGAARLDRVDLGERRASFAIGLLRPETMSKGLGTEAARRILSFAFSELNLHRISLRVLAINERAIRSYRKCGFRIEGRERETAFLDGIWHDDIIMGLLDRELRLKD